MLIDLVWASFLFLSESAIARMVKILPTKTFWFTPVGFSPNFAETSPFDSFRRDI
jgi:hypothetical protein